MVDVKAIFERVGVDLEDGIYGMSPAPLPRMKQLVKLMPAVEAGEVTFSQCLGYLDEVRAIRAKAGEEKLPALNADREAKGEKPLSSHPNYRMASKDVLVKCWDFLLKAKQEKSHLTGYGLAKEAAELYKGNTPVEPVGNTETADSQIKWNSEQYLALMNGQNVNGRVLINMEELIALRKGDQALTMLMDNHTVMGKRLIGEVPFNALEWIKANDQEAYQKAIAATTADLKAKAEEKVAAALAEQEKLLREQIYAQLGLTAPESKADNPAELPAPEQTAPAFTPAEPKAKKGKESDADFLDRVKALICENKDLNNDDYQRLLALKSKNNAVAAELVDLWETSPEISPEAPKD